MIDVLERGFSRLEQQRNEIGQELQSLTPEQLAWRPGDRSWSIAEVLDHVTRVERAVLEGARKPGVQRARWRRKPHRRFLAWLVFSAGVRIRVPERVKHVTPQRGASASEVLHRWSAGREELRTFLASLRPEQMGELAIKHPLAGPFTYRNFLVFLEWHLKHHRRQLKRIRAAGGFASAG